MNIFAISGLLNFVSVCGVGYFVYAANKAGKANRTFQFFVFAMAMWSGNYVLWQLAKDAPTALLFSRLLMTGTLFISITFFHFALAVLDQVKRRKKLLVCGYVFFFILLAFSFTPYLVSGVGPKLMFPYWPEPGILFHFYLVVWTFYFIYSCILLFKGYRAASGIRRTQLWYLFWAASIAYFGGWSNNLLWYNIPVPPYGNFGVPIIMIGIAYIMIKYSFLTPTPALAAETIVKAIPDTLLVFDHDLKVAFTNAPALQMLGYAGHELDGLPFSSIVGAGGRLAADLFRAPVVEYETDLIAKSGERIPVTFDSYPLAAGGSGIIGVVTVSHDMRQIRRYIQGLTEAKDTLERQNREMEKLNAELADNNAALAASREKISDLLTAVEKEKAGVEQTVIERTHELAYEKARLLASINALAFGFIIAGTDDRVILTNHALSVIVGSANVGGTVSAFAKQFASVDLFAAYRGSIERKEAVGLGDIEFSSKFLRLSSTPVILASGEVIGALIIIEDITEAKVLDRSKDEFFAIASHELRTPLTAIRSSAELILKEYAAAIPAGDMKELLGDIDTASVRLIRIVNDFLDVSRLEQGKIETKRERFDFSSLAKKTLEGMQAMAEEKGIELRYEEPAGPVPQALADADRVEQVVVNLVGNAIKFTDTGSVSVSAERAGRFIKVRVADTGRGIAGHNQPLLFRKFQQAGESFISRDVSQGTGLGLYISQLLVSHMGGTIKLEQSALGEGSVFTFTLPAAG